MKPARSTSDEAAEDASGGRRSSGTAASLGIAAGCYALAMSVFGTTLSLFLADAVGAGPGLIGLYFMGCAVAGIGINMAMGWLSDRLPDRRIALSSTALAGVAGALVFTGARDYAVVFATGAVLLGLNEAYISQMFAYVKEFADFTGREVTPFSSSVRSIFSAGWVIGPPVGLFLLVHAGFGRMYAGAAGLLLLTAILGRWFLPALIALQLPNALWIAVITSIPMVVVQQEVPGGTGIVSALYSSTFPVAQLLAGAVTGVVAAQAGYRSVFWICAGLCALAAVLLLFRAASRGTGDDGRTGSQGAAA
ncbi:MFS transporter [Streptomyces sp. NPDC058613]|uniref:MFS transporter n=1 Tax=Streptomyces sp. NPDC058613 TaxID=3346556 RepID=UPI00365EA545